MTDVFRSLEDTAGRFGPCVLTIGNFDGVHLGHRSLIRRTVERARANNCKAGLLTFYPHPTAIVAPDRVPEMICSLDERIELLAAAGVERILVLPFTDDVARMTPREFVERVVVAGLRARSVLVGENFRFGCRQLGTTEVLAQLGSEFGFETEFLPSVQVRGKIVSSSSVRRYIASGDVSRAGRFLGRCFSLSGEVVSGHGIGSKQTVPTLNLRYGGTILPRRGVYITETEDVADGRRWRSITNAGTRPTFAGTELTVETFLLSSFDGRTPARIRIRFRKWVREERTFPDPAALRSQIMKDVASANEYWNRLAWSQKLIEGRRPAARGK